MNSHFPVDSARSQTVNYPAKLIMKLDLIFSETRMQIASEIKLALSSRHFIWMPVVRMQMHHTTSMLEN